MSIKKGIYSLIGDFVIVLALCGMNTSALARHSSIQLSSNVTQLATSETVNKPLEGKLSSLDDKFGTALSWNKIYPNTITVNEDGRYFIMTVAQVGAEEPIPFRGADIMFWYTMNKKALASSGSWTFISATTRTETIVDQIIVNCKKGDKIGLVYLSSGVNAGLLANVANSDTGYPGSTSLSVSMFKIDS
ncbi:hypothetical protein GAMM_60163 [Gammaproteobacteria bacterium]